MSNQVSKEQAIRLARAFGEVCKIRVLDERTKEESLGSLFAVNTMQGVQDEMDIVVVSPKKLERWAKILREETGS